ncbi:MAG: Riboflavin kinase (EC / FMN adenylyltransferase (EC [uncultured Thiotrichaceae bacterium]|uniref:Riboflavin biosynthesis protein n=1 Tax=uncultured Thiotrichaceae bacterium TaxID=298394 RepID=A0A6S6TC86_9GAMM|nr:MAG: Riboflavin kinase (EC / FMN adenylyltransferase (EC [uncultured Thiotrichaceae bacterium]
MKLIRYPHLITEDRPACIATIGNFDGVHAGHREIIQHVIKYARQHKVSARVITFEPLPNEYFCKKFGKPAPKRIYPLRDKALHLQALGIDEFICLNFDTALAQMSAEDFITEVLIKQLKVKHLIVGDDFRFGKGRTGDFALLQSMGASLGMTVEDTNTIQFDDERISSSRIRDALSSGNISQATTLLGEPYRLSGRIRHGDKRGRTIGFPTLNLRLQENIVVARGVYAVKVTGLDDKTYTGVANLGTRPTVEGTELRLEAHVYAYQGDAYGKHACIELVHFIRPEQKFDNFDELFAQIKKDSLDAKQLLNTTTS